jgi:hypothetical protein
MDRESCFRRHLLLASIEAYHPQGLPYAPRPRWTAGPAAIAPPPSAKPGIDFALVGPFEEGIVVAFRGTLPPLDLSADGKRIRNPDIAGAPVILDWANDLRPALARGARVGPDTAGATIPGAVHQGLAGSLARLWPAMSAEIDRLRGQDAAPHLYFTGHSKGGTLANLAAACARLVWPGATVKAATFGAARPGDAGFAAAYGGIECHRFEVDGDPIPHVPPAGVEAGPPPSVHLCEPVGLLHRLAAVPHPPPIGFGERLKSLLPGHDNRWLIPPQVAAHLPYPGFGYADHVCEGCSHDWR